MFVFIVKKLLVKQWWIQRRSNHSSKCNYCFLVAKKCFQNWEVTWKCCFYIMCHLILGINDHINICESLGRNFLKSYLIESFVALMHYFLYKWHYMFPISHVHHKHLSSCLICLVYMDIQLWNLNVKCSIWVYGSNHHTICRASQIWFTEVLKIWN
jgi:hypothetical protein